MSIIDKVKELVSIMDENELSEIEIQEGETKIKVKKKEITYTPSIPQATMPPIYPVESGQEKSSYMLSKESEDYVEILSPMVGTFYRANAPGEEPCVSIGDYVNEESVVCIIEAMKIMNEVKAEVVGEVVDVCLKDGLAVEFGQPLFRIKPSEKTT